jgi:hypothetical protein
LNAGQDFSIYESLYRSQINEFLAKLTADSVEDYFKLVSKVRINVAHMPNQYHKWFFIVQVVAYASFMFCI